MDKYLKSNWSDEFERDFEALPEPIKDLAGDMFEIRWYGLGSLEWELEHNLLGSKAKAQEFMRVYRRLTPHQLDLIYHAYEA